MEDYFQIELSQGTSYTLERENTEFRNTAKSVILDAKFGWQKHDTQGPFPLQASPELLCFEHHLLKV